MVTKYVDSGNGSPSAPYESLATAATTIETIDALGLSAGDVVLVRSDHSEDSGATDWAFAVGVRLATIDASENYELMTTSVGSKTGTSADVTFTYGTWEGFYFTSVDLFRFAASDIENVFRDCTFELTNTGNYFSPVGDGRKVVFINCTFIQDASNTTTGMINPAADAQLWNFYGCTFTGTLSRLLFNVSSRSNVFNFYGCDFSGYGDTATTFQWSNTDTDGEAHVNFVNCISPDRAITYPVLGFNQIYDLTGVDPDHPWNRERHVRVGYMITTSTIYKTGGMALPDPTTNFSWQIISNTELATANNIHIFEAPIIWEWNDDTTNKNASIEVLLQDTGTVTTPTQWDMGIYMFALGSATTPLWSAYEDVFPQVGDNADGTPPSWSESGTNGNGWTGWTGNAKAFTITLPATQTIGRKGQVGVIFWCRNLAGNDALYLNPQVTLST